MESKAITNMEELREEIARLRGQETEQKIALAARFNGPSAIFGSVKTLFPKSSESEAAGGFLHPDLLKLAARFVIPFTLNKTVFRRSNFVVKALVGLVSQKAAGMVSEESAEGVLIKARSLFGKLFHKTNKGHEQESGKLRPNHKYNLRPHE